MLPPKWTLLGASGLALGVATGIVAARADGRHREGAPQATASSVAWLAVPRAAGAIDVDGEPDDPAWAGRVGRTRAFTLGGVPARPYTDARIVWRDDRLFLLLYAADEDLRGGDPRDPARATADAFRVVFHAADGDRAIDVSPTQMSARGAPDLAQRVRLGRDADGTLDMAADDDEEWLVEMSIPLDALGLRGAGDRIGMSIERCDTVRPRPGGDPGGRRCAGWGVTSATGIVLE